MTDIVYYSLSGSFTAFLNGDIINGHFAFWWVQIP